MNKKGFTLVEILVVLVLISLITVIVVPNVQKVAKESKVKLCSSKLELVEEAISLWTQDNYKCYTNNNCTALSNCTTTNNITTCYTTFGGLANEGIINYDKTENNNKIVINPLNNESINNETITIKYNSNNKSVDVSFPELCKF